MRPRATPARSTASAGGWCPVYSLIIATEPLPADDLGADRAAPPRDVQRPPAPDHLRPAHRRRPARLRRPRRAVPLRLADPPGVRPRRRGSSPRSARDARRPVPGAAATPRSPTRGAARSASPATGRASVGLDRGTGLGLGRRLRRRRRHHHQPGRPDPRRPRARPRHGADPAALGRPPLTLVGAGAAALAGHQRRAARDDARPTARRPGPAARAGSPGWSRRSSG